MSDDQSSGDGPGSTQPIAKAMPAELRTNTGTIRIEPEDDHAGDQLLQTLESGAAPLASKTPKPSKPAEAGLTTLVSGLPTASVTNNLPKSVAPRPAKAPRAPLPSVIPGAPPSSAGTSKAAVSKTVESKANVPKAPGSSGRWSSRAAQLLSLDASSTIPDAPPSGVLREGLGKAADPASAPLTFDEDDDSWDLEPAVTKPSNGDTAEATATNEENTNEESTNEENTNEEDAAEQGPPQIPALLVPTLLASNSDKPNSKKSARTRRRRSRRGRRRTVKIPDDAVPAATPTPSASEINDEPTMASAGNLGKSVVADSSAISILRPIQILNDLPPIGMRDDPDDDPVEPQTPAVDALEASAEAGKDEAEATEAEATEAEATEAEATEANAIEADAIEADAEVIADVEEAPALSTPPPPPRRNTDTIPTVRDAALEAIEEIIPDRMSMPAPAAPDTLTTAPSRPPPDGSATPSRPPPDGAARRPLPPPRSRGPTLPPPDALAHTRVGATTDVIPVPDTPVPSPAEAASSTANELEARAQAAEKAALEAEARVREAEARVAAATKKAAVPPRKAWYVEAFDSEFVRTLDNPKKRTVEREVNFIEKSLRLEKGSRVLDLACGTGVHAVELALRGYQLVGIDLSNTMLTFAREYNTKRSASVSFIQGDMRQLSLDGVFDGIYCWSTSFGYFDDVQNREVLKRTARALRPGGMLVMEVANRDFVAPRAPTMAWFEKVGCVCMDESRFDFFTSRIITKRMVLFDNGKSRELEMSIRLYPLHELGRALSAVGLKVLEVTGHVAHRSAFFGSESENIIITAQRTEEEA